MRSLRSPRRALSPSLVMSKRVQPGRRLLLRPAVGRAFGVRRGQVSSCRTRYRPPIGSAVFESNNSELIGLSGSGYNARGLVDRLLEGLNTASERRQALMAGGTEWI